MTLRDDLAGEVKAIFSAPWETQEARDVPTSEQLRLNKNHAKDLTNATVLYADLDGSTSMVDRQDWRFSAEVYKTYLRCAGEIVRSEGGVITAYDGDRVMAVFADTAMNTRAVRSALKINWAVQEIIRPALTAQYPNSQFVVNHCVGVDTSQMRAARIGVKGDNDIVWIGRAANYAAKLCAESGRPIWITEAVYNAIHDSVKFANGVAMWTRHTWAKMDSMIIYGTTYRTSL